VDLPFTMGGDAACSQITLGDLITLVASIAISSKQRSGVRPFVCLSSLYSILDTHVTLAAFDVASVL